MNPINEAIKMLLVEIEWQIQHGMVGFTTIPFLQAQVDKLTTALIKESNENKKR